MKVEIFYGDDWDGMYINGELVEEGHVLRAERAVQRVLSALADDTRPEVMALVSSAMDASQLERIVRELDGRMPRDVETLKSWRRGGQ